MTGIELLSNRVSEGKNLFLSVEEIRKTLTKLPEENRKAIELYYIRQMPKKEIAESLNWSLHKLNNKLTRGISLLKSSLIPGFFDQANAILARHSNF